MRSAGEMRAHVRVGPRVAVEIDGMDPRGWERAMASWTGSLVSRERDILSPARNTSSMRWSPEPFVGGSRELKLRGRLDPHYVRRMYLYSSSSGRPGRPRPSSPPPTNTTTVQQLSPSLGTSGHGSSIVPLGGSVATASCGVTPVAGSQARSTSNRCLVATACGGKVHMKLRR